MAKVEILAPFIFSWEGGFVNHPNDRGGATNMGVTIATYEAYCEKNGLGVPSVSALQNITRDEATNILKTMFWDRARADDIKNQAIANIIVDWIWASGTWGIKHTQRAIGVKVDGVLGPITLSKINSAEPCGLFSLLKQERESHFRRIALNDPTQQTFLKGWLNRLSGIKYDSLICNGGEVIKIR